MREVYVDSLIIAGLVLFAKALTVRLDSTEHALGHVTVAETRIETIGDQLLVGTQYGLNLISLQSNTSVLLINGSFTDVAYESIHGEILTLAEYEDKSQTIILWDANDLLRPVSLKLAPKPCWSAREFEHESNPALLISFDWISRNVYILTSCDSIHVCNTVSLKCNTVLHVENSEFVTAMFVHPKLGLLFYMEGRAGRIYRANMDGRSRNLIVTRGNNILGAALDYENSRLYWNDRKFGCLASCDMDGNLYFFENSFVADTKQLFNVAGIHRGKLYSTKMSSDGYLSVQRENLTGEQMSMWNFRQVLPKKGSRQVLLLSDREPKQSNPCSNNTCAQVCVPTSKNPDQPTCLQQEVKLLVTTTDAVLVVDLDGSLAWNNVGRIGNLSRPRGISHDFQGGYIFWGEELDDATVVKRHSLRDGSTTAVLTHEPPHLIFEEELQAASFDWITGNLYMVYRNTRRIYVCNITEAIGGHKCTEILTNGVAGDVGGLALYPEDGKMYWTQRELDKSSVATAYMDGSDPVILIGTLGTDSPAGIGIDFKTQRVFWVDSARRYIGSVYFTGGEYAQFDMRTHGYLPQHLGIHENGLYMAGSGSEHNSEIFFKNRKDAEELVLHLPNVSITSFTIFSSASQPNYDRKNDCENHPCPGICLLSGYTSFRCRCPLGAKSEENGITCAEAEDPRIIFTTTKHVFVRDKWYGDDRSVYAGRALVRSIAHSVDRQLIWLADHENVLEIKDVTFNPTGRRFSLVGGNIQSSTLSYDWIANNLYYVSKAGTVVICSCATGECIDTRKSMGTSSPAAQFALNPNMGFMYWCSQSRIIRVEMDGSTGRRDIISGCKEGPIAVDQETHSLFWLHAENWIASCDSNGQNMRLLAKVGGHTLKIAVRSSSVVWLTQLGKTRLYSCGKDNCDGLRGRKLSDKFVPDVYVGDPDSQPRKRKNPCSGNLCSHICVPTSTAYMRCVCPPELRLSSDGRSCECRGGAPCRIATKEPKLHPLPPTLPTAGLKPDCSAGDAFRCSNYAQCVNISQACDGIGDCADLSDEGPRCNDPCPQDFGCSYECIATPDGPTCVCRSGETLEEDRRRCVHFEIQGVGVESFTIALLVVGLVAAIFLVVSIIALFKYRQTKKLLRNLTAEEVDGFRMGDLANSDVAPDGEERALSLPYTHILEPDSLTIAQTKVLGSGEFGVVYGGLWNNSVPVAVKTFEGTLDVDEFKAVLAEVKIMAYLQDLGGHEHVLKFVGSDVSEISAREIKVVTELSPYGDLLHYLRKHTPRSQAVSSLRGYTTMEVPDAEITAYVLVNWCEQIADGMEYLTLKKIIHGDLASRNVLVFSNNTLKISDFGLSKKLYACSQYRMKRQRKLPWQWASIELLTRGEFSEASDVWSFGITAWEIFTFGETPYCEMAYSNYHQLVRDLREGNRLAKPPEATDAIYQVLLECWDTEATDRPTFTFLKGFFQEQMIIVTSSSSSERTVESSVTEPFEPPAQASADVGVAL